MGFYLSDFAEVHEILRDLVTGGVLLHGLVQLLVHLLCKLRHVDVEVIQRLLLRWILLVRAAIR